MSVVASPLAFHTDRVAGNEKATVFITEAAGFTGTGVVPARGHKVFDLAPSPEAASRFHGDHSDEDLDS